MYGLSEKVFITGLSILFVTVVLGGVFVSQVAAIWLKNKREERIHQMELSDLRRYDGFEAERSAWLSACNKKDEIIRKKDELISGMNDEIISLTRDYENAKTLLGKVNLEGETIA